jgi:hypothetical protein
MTFYIHSDGKLNHVLDNKDRICGYRGKLKYLRTGIKLCEITCEKCLDKLPGYVLRELGKVMQSVRRKHEDKLKR